MQNTYIIKLASNKIICFYYLKENGILYRIYENNNWSNPVTVFKNALENYSVTLGSDNIIYLFCQDTKGNVYLSTNSKGIFSSKVILENKGNFVHILLFVPIVHTNGITLVYNAPTSKNDSGSLLYQQLSKNNIWSQPKKIDNYINFKNSIFQVQQVTKNHILLFYQTKSHENKFGYVELTPSKHSNMTIFHTTIYQIKDQSFLTTNTNIYFLYIVKNNFSSQLIYRSKSESGFSKPLIICEFQKIDSCIVAIICNDIIAFFTIGSKLFKSVSKDGGKNFSKPSIENPSIKKLIKSFIICENPLDEQDFFIREVYVEESKPWEIQILPDLVSTFFPKNLETHNVLKNSSQEIAQDLSTLRETIEKQNNKIYMLQNQLKEKDNQLINISSTLNSKNIEISLLHKESNEKLKKYLYELELINLKYNDINSEYQRLKDSLDKKTESD